MAPIATDDQITTDCRWCNNNMSYNDPASQYQTLKIIQNTVRVPASLYMNDLAALNVYQTPGKYGVNWNQMSDRRVRHVQPTTVAGGSFYHASSTRGTITRCRPGAGCPGGSGVDIKHNSYDRYLNRIKGKGPVRRGVIPPDFGKPIVFNPAFPIYGGKTTKTSIVSGGGYQGDCICGDQNDAIYDTLADPQRFQYYYEFDVGTYVYATNADGYYVKALVLEKMGTNYIVQYDDGTVAEKNISELLVYYPCNSETC
jgi:hypothetical protein